MNKNENEVGQALVGFIVVAMILIMAAMVMVVVLGYQDKIGDAAAPLIASLGGEGSLSPIDALRAIFGR